MCVEIRENRLVIFLETITMHIRNGAAGEAYNLGYNGMPLISLDAIIAMFFFNRLQIVKVTLKCVWYSLELATPK